MATRKRTKSKAPRNINPIAKGATPTTTLAPTWVYLANPVPQPVANRAAQLLKTPGLHVGMAWIETTTVQCTTTVSGVDSLVLRYTCENHEGGKIGISVYGLT